MAQVQNELMKEAAEKGTKINEDELTKRVQQVLNNGKLLQFNFNCFNKIS